MSIIGVIPVRMRSSRFPGKPLAKICGIPMVGHIYLRSKMSKILDKVYIATCDKEIEEYGKLIGAEVIMTKDTHKRASDRTAEAMLKIERKTGRKAEIVAMIQGDEPMIVPRMIDLAINPMLKDRNILVVNLMGNLKNKEEHEDPHEIKVVVDDYNYALYFSRSPIPFYGKNNTIVSILKQICVIPFRRNFLLKFNSLKPTILEEIESIDMLRVLGHGYKVKMVVSKYNTYSVDTPQDLKKVENLMQKDPLIKLYGSKKYFV